MSELEEILLERDVLVQRLAQARMQYMGLLEACQEALEFFEGGKLDRPSPSLLENLRAAILLAEGAK